MACGTWFPWPLSPTYPGHPPTAMCHHLPQPPQALLKAARLAKSGSTAVHAYRLLAQMRQGLGDHLGAVTELNRGLAAADRDSQRIELRFLRGETRRRSSQPANS